MGILGHSNLLKSMWGAWVTFDVQLGWKLLALWAGQIRGLLFLNICNWQIPNANILTNLQHNPMLVYRQASNLNVLKEGMKIEAAHVKRKHLHYFLPAETIQKKKKVL